MFLGIAQNENESQKFRYEIIKMDFENTAVIEQIVETNNQALINHEPK